MAALPSEHFPSGALRTLLTASAVLLIPVAGIIWAVDRGGLTLITTILPTYHAAVVIAVGILVSISLWFALSGLRTSAESGSRLEISERLALLQSIRSSRRLDELMFSISRSEGTGGASQDLLARESTIGQLIAARDLEGKAIVESRRPEEEPSGK